MRSLRPTAPAPHLFWVIMIALLAPTAVAAATIAYFYTYDPSGRLTTQAGAGTCVAYSYDANGNRTSQTNTIGGGPVASSWGSATWGCALWSP